MAKVKAESRYSVEVGAACSGCGWGVYGGDSPHRRAREHAEQTGHTVQAQKQHVTTITFSATEQAAADAMVPF